MIAKIALSVILALAVTPALSQPAQSEAPSPVVKALSQMLQEAQGREANALMQLHALRDKSAELEAALSAERKRAAEAKP